MTITTDLVKLSPMHSLHRMAGAEFHDAAGWRIVSGYGAPEVELEAMRTGVGLADMSAIGKLEIEGIGVEHALRTVLPAVPEKINTAVVTEGGFLIQLRQDQFLLTTPPGREAEAARQIESKIAEMAIFGHATDSSHGQAAMLLIGPASREVLRKLCALDFHPERFPNLSAGQSSLARVRALVFRRDLGETLVYQIHVARSYGAYVWETLMDAGAEFDIRPVGTK